MTDDGRAARLASISQNLVKASDIDLQTVRRAKAERHLIDFVRQGWKSMDSSKFVDSWHIGAVCEHLEAVTNGEIPRLVINVPPRTSKSLLCSVAWPAWTWIGDPDNGDLTGPHIKFLCASYAQDLSNSLSVQCRRLIQSQWYQDNWKNNFQLLGDQNAKMHFDNSAGGYRMATAVGGGLTGKGGDIILVDDPHNVKQAESQKVREGTLEWFDQALPSRFNDPKTGAMVVIMQRVHAEDISSRCLDLGYEHLMLPMRLEPERKFYTSIGFIDPREEEGELLCPDRFGDDEVDRLERTLGPFGFAGQYQQRPEPKGGGIFKTDWWKDWNPPNGAFPQFSFMVASLDSAYEEKKENDFSALTIWGIWYDRENVRTQSSWENPDGLNDQIDKNDAPKIMLVYAWQDKLDLHARPREVGESKEDFKKRRGLVERVGDDCRRFKVDLLLIEAKASGISVAQEIRRLYSAEEFGVQMIVPKADKVARAYAVQPLFSQGLVSAPLERTWADRVVQQMSVFPKSAHDDLVDSATQALNWMRSSGVMKTPDEHQREQRQDRPVGKPKPLYPV